jgi:hypothetical protein
MKIRGLHTGKVKIYVATFEAADVFIFIGVFSNMQKTREGIKAFEHNCKKDSGMKPSYEGYIIHETILNDPNALRKTTELGYK